VFAWVVAHSGTSRNAILSVVAFFVAGAAILAFVNVREGRAAVATGERRGAGSGA
jgi:UMF1 family MFS transporter